jgi:hypothetical protein
MLLTNSYPDTNGLVIENAFIKRLIRLLRISEHPPLLQVTKSPPVSKVLVQGISGAGIILRFSSGE